MTTQTHALKMPSQVTALIIELSSEYHIDLNTVDGSVLNLTAIGDIRCGKQIIITKSLVGDVYMVRVVTATNETLRSESVSIEEVNIMPYYSLEARLIKSSKQEVITRLERSLEALVKPLHSDFFNAVSNDIELEKGRPLDDEGFKKAYEESDRRYSNAYSEFLEKRAALEFAIKHYQDQIKLELAHAIIDLDGE